ncbi:hypothetical protein B0H19DRAFT_1275601 [Mycena capillaripes]|nr:hypothetical protein B0H19DRAFT_1275601 [Mycena capillaripes]
MPLDVILGALLVGTWAGSLLYTVEIIQAAYYYRHFKHDNWMLKLLVSSALAIDSMSMISNYAAVYLVTRSLTGEIWNICRTSIGQVLSYWKKYNQTHVIAQPEPFYVYTTGIVAAMAQSFLTTRYLLLTKNKFITLTLFCFITVAIGGAFATATTLAIFPRYKDRGKVVIPATIWLVSEAVTDISIALALLLQFRQVKSSFKETRSLVNRLVAQTIQTGAAGATIAFASVAAFLANNQSNVPTGIAYCLGRIYCITMLVVLNRRKTGKTSSGGGTSLGKNHETHGERGNQQRSEGGDEYGGIHVHRTAVVRIDTAKEFSKGSFKTNPGQGHPNGNPALEIEMTANDSASYSSKKKQDLLAP